MTPQDDLTAERAAELCFKLALLIDTGTHLEVDTEAMEAIAHALKNARQEALREAAEKVRKRGDEYMQNCEASYQDTYEMRRVNSGRARALKDVADALDRLASEGAPSPIDLLPKFNDDGNHG